MLSMLQDQVSFALCLMPLGAKKQLQGDFDVKVHWIANCLPALALSKTGIPCSAETIMKGGKIL